MTYDHTANTTLDEHGHILCYQLKMMLQSMFDVIHGVYFDTMLNHSSIFFLADGLSLLHSCREEQTMRLKIIGTQTSRNA
jgi:hypothetical protein